ncbi:hypothetical protein GKQ77_21465 [Streptomyces sp. BG9H]|uniref:Aminoglycoside phosphotransferase domain-containing protein n=1 Tax=Streptomyces anatolicus TaxID=2675858 RepID=A0ABS6YRP2_9ACTN|nr:phosphotransferase [Streptomyces anatolicus]MBW5424103.1 hypothetical protein [Streptomyces anatolicus]
MNFSAIPLERGGEPCLLVLDGGTRWELPRHRHSDPREVNSALHHRYGVEVGTLDVIPVPTGAGEDGAPPSYLFVHETHSPGTALPRGARWAPVAELAASCHRFLPGQERLLGLWSACRDRREDEAWLPWRRPGWFAEVTGWAAEELHGIGVEVVGPAEQDGFRAWSCQLRLPTTAGVVHLKASPPPHAHEPALTRLLAEWFPGAVPRVLAWDSDRRLMLTADFGPVSRPVGAARVAAGFAAVARRIGVIQRQAAAYAAEIAATGCPAHRLTLLPERFEGLLDEVRGGGPGKRITPVRRSGQGELTDEESLRLRRLVPALARDCARLAALDLPESVVHHDLWRGNFRVEGDEALVFDWADSVLTHPFLQLDVLLGDLAAAGGSAGDRERVLGGYLAAWAGHRPPTRLREGAALAARIAPVSRALLMRDRLTGAPSHIRRRYRGAVTAPLRARLAPDRAGAGT